jgi:hypothetical protein
VYAINEIYFLLKDHEEEQDCHVLAGQNTKVKSKSKAIPVTGHEGP